MAQPLDSARCVGRLREVCVGPISYVPSNASPLHRFLANDAQNLASNLDLQDGSSPGRVPAPQVFCPPAAFCPLIANGWASNPHPAVHTVTIVSSHVLSTQLVSLWTERNVRLLCY